MNVSFAAQKFLGGMRYPASKQAIIEHARKRGANGPLLGALLGLPDQLYESPVKLSSEIGRQAELTKHALHS